MDALPLLSIGFDRIGKRHGRQWILRNVEGNVPAGGSLVLLGANGSGKSSLLRLLCGFDAMSEGQLHWTVDEAAISREDLMGALSYCAPDQSLILDLTVAEHIAFHQNNRTLLRGLDLEGVLRLALLEDKGAVRVRDLSSGMRQRLALALAFATSSCGIFLDEPTSHLDEQGRQWYGHLLAEWRFGRTLVVASNHNAAEYPSDSAALTL